METCPTIGVILREERPKDLKILHYIENGTMFSLYCVLHENCDILGKEKTC